MKKTIKILNNNKFLAALIVAICFFSVLTGLANTVQRFNTLRNKDALLANNNAVQILKENLPEKGFVAYVTDNDYDLRSLSLLQYALSPLILIHSKGQQRIIKSINGPSSYEQFCNQYPNPEYIVGYFNTKSGYNDFCENNSVEIIVNLDKRIMLFKRL